MKKIDRIKKHPVKWVPTRIKAETMKKVQKAVQAQDQKNGKRGASQQVFIDNLVNIGLS